jgi:hypothetical protein
MQSGDFVNMDGTGSATVYPTKENPNVFETTIQAEENNLGFIEPYLLAMAANEEGQTGS